MKNIIQPKRIDLGAKRRILPGPEPALDTAGRVIRVCEPDLSGNELKYVMDAVRSGWISSGGPYVKKFEDTFAKKVGCRYGVSTTSATTALHLIFALLRIGRGDEVIMPTFTMAAAANMLYQLGATPILIDADPRTWTMNPAHIEKKITKKTKMIVAIHIYGYPADMDPIMRIAKKYRLWLVEDAAEAHGARYHGRKAGSMSDAAAFSFYGNKIITTGEGGMVTTNNPEIARKARILRDHGFSETARFWHEYAAFNYRMTNLQAAVGVAQTERFDKLANRRIRNAKLYNRLLGKISGITLPPETAGIKNVTWMYGILIDKEKFGMTRDGLRAALARRGIETRSFFVPIHLQPVFYDPKSREQYPVSEMLCERGLYLPQSSKMTDEEVWYVAEHIKTIHRECA